MRLTFIDYGLLFWLFTAIHVNVCDASLGDQSQPYRKCLKICDQERCWTSVSRDRFHAWQPLTHWMLQWSCVDECKHECMWEAVAFFQSRGHAVPQFHGKWPFARLWGMQEPASAVASILNGLAHFLMLKKFLRVVPSTTPFFHLWRFQAFVCINAWFWSFVFHVRDTDWTEKLDYFCALSLILVQLFTCLVRMVGATPASKPLMIGGALGTVFLHHCFSMSFIHFDYGYNMTVNICFAAANVLVWGAFAVVKISRGYSYYWKALISLAWFSLSALLETLEFTPVFWVLDSHALWHFTTAPLPLLYYSFIIEDSLTLLRGKELENKSRYHFELDIDDDSGGKMK